MNQLISVIIYVLSSVFTSETKAFALFDYDKTMINEFILLKQKQTIRPYFIAKINVFIKINYNN